MAKKEDNERKKDRRRDVDLLEMREDGKKAECGQYDEICECEEGEQIRKEEASTGSC